MSAARAARRLVLVGLLGSAVLLVSSALPSLSCGGAGFLTRYNALRSDPYPLDVIDRDIVPDAALACPEIELVTHRGEALRYEPPVRVAPPFLERLQRFERIVTSVAVSTYGRAPSRVLNAGAYSCRPVRHRSYRLSEHALGNALDLVGFRFGPLRADQTLPVGAPNALRRAFDVNLVRAWAGADVHRRFVEGLFAALEQERVFRALLGPGHEAHREAGHFHVDCGPWPVVAL